MKSDLELALLVTSGVIGLGLAAAAISRCLNGRKSSPQSPPPSPPPSPPSSPPSSSSPAQSEEAVAEIIVVPPPPPPPAFIEVVVVPPAHVEPPAGVPRAAAGIATIFTNLIGFFADVSSEIVRR